MLNLLQGELFLGHDFYTHIGHSLSRWGTGFLLATIFGVCCGLIMGWFPGLRSLFMPIVCMLQNIPSLAWIPVAILLLGLGNQTTVFIIFLAGLFAIIVNTVIGVRSIDHFYIRAARMLGAGQLTLFTKILLPGATPHILSGLRIGLANGWRALIAAEMVAAQGTGLGYVILQSRWNFDYTSAFASILIIAVIAIFVEGIFESIEMHTIKQWGLDHEKRG